MTTSAAHVVSDTTSLEAGEEARAGEEDSAVVRVVPASQPSPRGGHQLCIDSGQQHIYLYGGWDGTRDLTDFWQVEPPQRRDGAKNQRYPSSEQIQSSSGAGECCELLKEDI